MIESFFQSLERHGVEYLLISGQATVLYGAATFSEDVDLWVNPSQENVSAFLAALQAEGARYYKLTPPLTHEHLLRRHGFHFTIPDEPDLYLDVMGCPPRSPEFEEARAACTRMPTVWGVIPTVGIKHLVSLKTTQRLSDYPVIGQLVLRYLEARDSPEAEDLEWAVSNVYTQDDLDEVLDAYPDARLACRPFPPLWDYISATESDGAAAASVRDGAERYLTERMLLARKSDRAYWKSIIAELQVLRQEGQLMPVGSPVQP